MLKGLKKLGGVPSDGEFGALERQSDLFCCLTCGAHLAHLRDLLGIEFNALGLRFFGLEVALAHQARSVLLDQEGHALVGRVVVVHSRVNFVLACLGNLVQGRQYVFEGAARGVVKIVALQHQHGIERKRRLVDAVG